MKGILVNNSKVPVILSNFSPIEIWAITLWPFIFCRGSLDERTINHERIHIQQYNELFVVGFLILYAIDYVKGMLKYKDDLSGISPHNRNYTSPGNKAYYQLRAEQEAYENDDNLSYLSTRVRWQWINKFKV